MVPFAPRGMTAEQVRMRCIEARRSFYSLRSIFNRGIDWQVNGSGWFMWRHFFAINLLFRHEVLKRMDFPLGDEAWCGTLLKAEHREPFTLEQAPALAQLV